MEKDQTLLIIDGVPVQVPPPPELPEDNTPVIIHFSVLESSLVEGSTVIPITVVGNIPCVGYFVSTSPVLPNNPNWTSYPPQTIDIATQ